MNHKTPITILVADDDADDRPGRRAEQDEGLAGEGRDELAEQAEGRLVVELEEDADRDEGQHHRRQHQHQENAAEREDSLLSIFCL